MTVDPSVVPGLLFLLAELVTLAGVGYVIVRTALRETDQRVALAQGLIVGPAIWGLVVNFVMYATPGMAGAVAGWIFVLGLAAVLVWRAPESIRPRLRVAAGFALIALTLFWIALASRQTLGIDDDAIRLGLPASIREGGFPPELPWNPGMTAPYHYGVNLLHGLLAPPSGPDLAFAKELLGAYAWICLALVVATALLRRASGFAMLIIAPLLLTAGASTLVFNQPAGVVQAPVPTGIPSAGVRASLTEIYRPAVDPPRDLAQEAPPNISKPRFTLSYALALVVLARAAYAGRRSWLSVTTLAALVGFLGLTSTSLAPMVIVLWAGLEAIHLIKSRRAGSSLRSDAIRSALGLALAALLLLAGSFSYLVLGGSTTSGLSLGGNEYVEGRRMLGTLDRLPGGVGIVGLGPLAVAGVALLLAWRDRLVLALAAGTCLLLPAALLLSYEPQPLDVVRFEGHARNLALFALLIALGVRLAGLRPARLRYAAAAALLAVVTWPTIAAPVRNVGLAVGNGIELANAQPKQYAPGTRRDRRYVLKHLISNRIADYIRSNTAVDARVFSPYGDSITFTTGRPNAVGFPGLVHVNRAQGPDYRDVLDFLEPTAVRRLGFEYVHAPDVWVEGLPEEAAGRLNDPRLFELLVRDDSESLYRVLPAFLALDPPPAPGSHEALRQAVPASATVFLLRYTDYGYRKRGMIRVASALSHTRLRGFIDQTAMNLRTPWRAQPLGDHVPDLVIAPANFAPWMLPPALRQPIWWNDDAAVYALHGTVDPIMPPPPRAQPFPFSVTLSDVRPADSGGIAFTATFYDRAPPIRWNGQDWVLFATKAPPWRLPVEIIGRSYIPPTARWFAGHIVPGSETTSHAYEFDLRGSGLAARSKDGGLRPVQSSRAVSGTGSYVLAVRLRYEDRPGIWRVVAFVPVLNITVSETGEVSYQVHEEASGREPVQ